jgi:hypothetical protein
MSEKPPQQKAASGLPLYTLPKRRSPLRRAGCTLAVVLWFMVLLTPCFCIVLATQGEIAVRLGDIPGQSFRVWLVNESRQRGLGIARPAIVAGESDGQRCLQTDVNFVLWTGTAEGSTYCECYTQSDDLGDWELISTQQSTCQAR